MDRVNISSQATVMAFILSGLMSRVFGSSISASVPSGAMSFTISSRCLSVPVSPGDKVCLLDADALHLCIERFVMVDRVVGTHLLAPCDGLGARG